MKSYINNNIKKFTGMVCMAAALIINSNQAKAQISGLQSSYYLNQYLANPAMAGMETGLNINMGYQQQWTSVPGGPKLQNFTADYNAPDSRVGLGFNVNGDQAGLTSRTRVMGTYAYHLPLNANDDKLNFGLSVGINDTYIDYNKVNGDQGDASVQNFNQRSVYIDGDLGVSYTTSKLTVQGALPNLKSIFFSTAADNLEIDRATFYSAISYKLLLANEYSNFTLEPKVAFRGVKGFDNIFDIGTRLNMNDYNINFTGMYHTNKSATLAFGINLDTLGFELAYTDNTGPLSVYANNTFELGVKLKLFNK